jgi:hypothetical protein
MRGKSEAVRGFHRQPSDEDPSELLDPENQWSTPWGESDHGACDKCGGGGQTEWHCLSCYDQGREGCPACQGRVRYLDRCPACEGTGEITRTKRRGVSVFPTVDGLLRYLAGEDPSRLDDAVIVELEGELSGDEDLDADQGALLILPERIVRVHEVDRQRAGALLDRTPGMPGSHEARRSG